MRRSRTRSSPIFPPPPVQGLGTIGGFKLQIEDRGGLGRRALYKAMQAPDRPRRAADARSWPASSRASRSTCRSSTPTSTARRPSAGRAAARRLRHDADLSRLALRQRLQPLRPHLPGDRAGRRAVPRASPTTSCAQDAQRAAARWCRSARSCACRETTGPDRVMRYNAYPAADINGGPAPGFSSGQAQARRSAEDRSRNAAARHELRVDRAHLSAEARRQHGHPRLPAVRAARVPGARRAVRELVAAARDHPDRADVPALPRSPACG